MAPEGTKPSKNVRCTRPDAGGYASIRPTAAPDHEEVGKPLKSALPPFLLHVLADSISTTADYDNCPQRLIHTLSGVARGFVTIHDEPNADYENRHLCLRLSFDVEAFDKFNILFRMCLVFRCNIPE